ncbi:MAG TPA: 16S rRNA (cytosine(1402)-N(4))-methyltransferase RsmH [Candidatus Paceibacterota bacterium]|nr:16S rRNA (cytosine(1402)-N(4))-methyltransferase RsmH [Candidatus Paceibacterota bacterium]
MKTVIGEKQWKEFHDPVLLHEVIKYLNLAPGKRIIDATLDGGGHAKGILQQYPYVSILGIEWDPLELEEFRKKNPEWEKRIVIVGNSYINLEKIVEAYEFIPDGILFDLGLSSWHYEHSGRGFSFQRSEPLDMRFNPNSGQRTAADIVNTEPEAELERILSEYGEEQFAESIARAIVQARKEKPIVTTDALTNIIFGSVPKWYTRRKIHPATKIFQALRIVVNDELNNVRKGIEAAIKVMAPGGRLLVISFQGLEDKIVREIFKEKVQEKVVQWVIRDTIRPSWEEIKKNPRARSAKMKVIEKL